MEYIYLHTINYPSDLKKLPIEALPVLCNELRDFIIRELSQNPGHLGSSLGTIELTVALHYVFDTPQDQLVWDVGHQAYAHKILTGRKQQFHTNRQFKGIAPFPTPAESEYDAFVAGHASNSISAALGIDVGETMQREGDAAKKHVVAIIGDGAMTGGLAFEGLNNTSMNKNNLLIVLNDNNMAIDPIKGGITQYLVDITTSKCYNRWRWKLYLMARKMHLITDHSKGIVQRFTNNLKALLTKQGNNIFQGLNIRYFGPADGHNVMDMVRIFSEIKDYEGPKVLHIITKKGKGYEPAENDQTTWHAPGEFNMETGVRSQEQGIGTLSPLWQEVFGQTLLSLAQENKRIVGVTPAMPSGCSMNIMQKVLPERVYDVGIAEGHAVTFSAGLAKAGIIPYCNIYSSFMQRAYDNIIHDVALPKLHVVLCIDRAGIVGNDGATHHGLLDLAYLRPIPNLIIGAPMTDNDLREMMRIAQDVDGPIAIRYPRGRAVVATDTCAAVEVGQSAKVGEWDMRLLGEETMKRKVAVLSIGAIGNTVEEAIEHLLRRERDETMRKKGERTPQNTSNVFGESAEGIRIVHYDMRWLKPIDEDLLHEVGKEFDTIVTAEDGMIKGGLGSAVLEFMADNGYTPRMVRLGVKDQFVEHGSTKELYKLLKLDKEGLCESLLQVLAQ